MRQIYPCQCHRLNLKKAKLKKTKSLDCEIRYLWPNFILNSNRVIQTQNPKVWCLYNRYSSRYKVWGGWVRQRCRVSYVTGASNWYWLTVGQGLLSLQQVRVQRECFISSVFFSLPLIYLFSPVPLFHLLYYLFSLSVGGDTKWPTRIDVLNPNTIIQNQGIR